MSIMGKIKDYFTSLSLLCRIPSHYSDYLVSGVYRWNSSATVLYSIKDKEQISSIVGDFFVNIHNTNNCFRHLFTFLCLFRIKNTTKLFNGQFLTISSSSREYRLFDLNEKRLLTVFLDSERGKQIIEKRIYWKMYIPTVPFEIKDDCKIFEPLVEKKSFISQYIFKELLSIYINYFKKITNSFDFSWCDYNNEEKPNGTMHLPCVITHGDLWRSNIIYDGDQVFIIDFEHSKRRLFYYDLFTYMLMDYAMFSDSSIWNDYLKGNFDDFFAKAFSIFGIDYITKNRRNYFSVFIRLFLLERPTMAADTYFSGIANKMLNDL